MSQEDATRPNPAPASTAMPPTTTTTTGNGGFGRPSSPPATQQRPTHSPVKMSNPQWSSRTRHRQPSVESCDVSPHSEVPPVIKTVDNGSFAIEDSSDEAARSGSQPDSSTSTPASMSQPRTSMSGMPADFVRLLVEKVKTAVVQDLQHNAVVEALKDCQSSTSSAAVSSPPSPSSPSTLELDTKGLGVARDEATSVLNNASDAGAVEKIARRKSSVRWSDRDRPSLSSRSTTAPDFPSQSASDRRPSILKRPVPDIGWGPLFDADGSPTERLSRFLRGIATYLVSEYQPVASHAIVPAKMEAFYTEFMLETEMLPVQDIFKRRSKGGLERIENLYLDLRCEHVLVQAEPRYAADIPSLTPAGFETWMRRLLLAYPDQEAQRLSMIVAKLPINPNGSRIDDKAEKLYTSVPRRLFPATKEDSVRQKVWMAMAPWRRLPDRDPPPRRHTNDEGIATKGGPRDGSRADQHTQSVRASSTAPEPGSWSSNIAEAGSWNSTIHPVRRPIIRQASSLPVNHNNSSNNNNSSSGNGSNTITNGHSSSNGSSNNNNNNKRLSDHPNVGVHATQSSAVRTSSPTLTLQPVGSGSSHYVLSSEGQRETRYYRNATPSSTVELAGNSKAPRKVYIASTTPRWRREGSSELEDRERTRDRDRERESKRKSYHHAKQSREERMRDDPGPTYGEVYNGNSSSSRMKTGRSEKQL